MGKGGWSGSGCVSAHCEFWGRTNNRQKQKMGERGKEGKTEGQEVVTIILPRAGQ